MWDSFLAPNRYHTVSATVFPALTTSTMMVVVIVAAACQLFVAVTSGILVTTASCTSAEKFQLSLEVWLPLPSLTAADCPACGFPRGLSVVPDEEVIEMYEGSHVPLEQMSDFYGKVMRNYLSKVASLFPLRTVDW